MAHTSSNVVAKDIQTVDPVWSRIREEAEQAIQNEPVLSGFIYAAVLAHKTFEHAVCYRLAQLLDHGDVDASLLVQIFEEVLSARPELGEKFRADILAVYDRDPACVRLLEPLLYFKGFHALQTYRFSHELRLSGSEDMALYLQSMSSRKFAVDINPSAKIGRGIMLDHATGLVFGETAEIADNVSILHGVNLGGTGKEVGDRHPKIGSGVMIGADAKILGNISVGDCSRIGAGSVVTKDVPPNTTVAGVPARIIGDAGCTEPARTMDQMLGSDEAE